MDAKPLLILFSEIDRFIKIYDRIRCLKSFGTGLYDAICNIIRYR